MAYKGGDRMIRVAICDDDKTYAGKFIKVFVRLFNTM